MTSKYRPRSFLCKPLWSQKLKQGLRISFSTFPQSFTEAVVTNRKIAAVSRTGFFFFLTQLAIMSPSDWPVCRCRCEYSSAACQLVTLLSSTETNVLFDVDIVVKTKRPWISVVCTLIETIFVITVVKICYELTRLCLVSPQRLWNLSIGFATVFSTNLLARPRARTMSYQHSKEKLSYKLSYKLQFQAVATS